MSTTSDSLPCEDIPTDRLSFLVKCGSSLTALRHKLNQRNTKEVRIIDNRNIVDEIKRLKEEVKTAKESLIPSFSLDKKGGDKVIEKFEGILKELIAVDRRNEERYEELLEELEEMKDNRGLNLDSHKQTSGGTNGGGLSYSSQVLPLDGNFMEGFNKLPSTQRERLLRCSRFAELYKREAFIPHNVGISKGVLINWLIGMKIIDDPLEGEQFIEALLADPSFYLISDYRSSRIIISPYFARSLSMLLTYEEYYLKLKYTGDVILLFPNEGEKKSFVGDGDIVGISSSLITINNRIYRINDEMIQSAQVYTQPQTRVVVHFGNFHSGMDYVVADDTFSSKFDGYLKESKDIRFLSLRGISRIPELPRSVCEVSELKVLDLRSCQDLRSLPNDIKRLIKLVCLDLSECYQLNHIPKSIACLKYLRVLLGFIVVTDNLPQPKDPKHRFAEFDDLKYLRRLIKLTIRTRRKSFPTNEDLQTLNSMQELRKLKVAWVQSFVVQSTTTEDVPSKICLDTQELPKTLEKLELQAASDTTASQLLELISNKRSHNRRLEKLYIRGGNLQKLYPDQHCFPQVKILHLRYLHQLHMRWNDFQLSFPNLSYLRIAECPNLIFFPCNEKGEWIQSESSW